MEDNPNAWDYSPFFLMFGRRARLPIVSSFVSDTKTVLEYAYRHVHDTMRLKQDRQKELYDRKRHGEFYQMGDLMWLHSSVVPHGASRKFHQPWTGS